MAFKGDDSTFGSFPEYLKVIVNNALPNINVRALVYPRYETRGDLEECVKEFKEWQVLSKIDLNIKIQHKLILSSGFWKMLLILKLRMDPILLQSINQYV